MEPFHNRYFSALPENFDKMQQKRKYIILKCPETVCRMCLVTSKNQTTSIAHIHIQNQYHLRYTVCDLEHAGNRYTTNHNKKENAPLWYKGEKYTIMSIATQLQVTSRKHHQTQQRLMCLMCLIFCSRTSLIFSGAQSSGEGLQSSQFFGLNVTDDCTLVLHLHGLCLQSHLHNDCIREFLQIRLTNVKCFDNRYRWCCANHI